MTLQSSSVTAKGLRTVNDPRLEGLTKDHYSLACGMLTMNTSFHQRSGAD